MMINIPILKRLSLLALLMCISMQVFTQEQQFSTYYHQRKSHFENLPNSKNEIILLGNSITDGCEWSELFNNNKIKNRGISGDTTEGVLCRISEVTESNPAKVFLMIGINDLARGVSRDTIYANICRIANLLVKQSPKCKVYIQSILPVNPVFGKFSGHCSKTDDILWINEQLDNWCKSNDARYIDLFSKFKNEGDNYLDKKYTNDGLHLTGAGYLLWADFIKPYIS